MKFNELRIHSDLIKGLEKAKYIDATPVQEAVLAEALEGNDLYVQSQTGTGKTAAYLIPMIQSLLANESLKGKKALIMVPTRELAVQVEKEARLLSAASKLKTASFYGGVGYEKQTEALQKGVDILVGTPGRVLDLQETGTMSLKEIAVLVVDEADRMFDMGFYPDLRKLIKLLPDAKQRQTMLFSATLNSYVKNLAWEYTVDAKEITIDADSITLDEIEQKLFHISSDQKMELLLGMLKNENPQSAIIFCNTKKSCEIVSKRLVLNGIKNEYIMGDLVQTKRLKIIESVKKGALSILIATDVAARGIDINDLEMVINYDLPNESENYVHRIGRTARAGKKGKAYSFCSEQDVYNLPAIEKYLEKNIPSELADEKLLVEDKSKGVYIRLDADEKNFEQRAQKSFSQNKNFQSNRKSKYQKPGAKKNLQSRTGAKASQKGKKSFSQNSGANYSKQKIFSKDASYKKNEQFTENLSNLSFDERMKLYKEKYGQGENTQRNQNYTKSKKQNHQKNLAQKGNKNFANKNNVKSHKDFSNKNKPQSKDKKTKTKKGFFGNLFSFMNKNKD